jgi:hypothetical protein
MGKIISIHEYELKSGVNREEFEQAVQEARNQGLFQLPGLVEFHFIKGIRGVRKDKFCAVWVYESREAWERLWGPIDIPQKKNDYPENWKKWENEVLAPFLSTDPDKINFTAYEEF